MVIAQQHGHLRAGDDEDDKDEKQKSKHAVQLMRPEIEHNKYNFIAPPIISILISFTIAHVKVFTDLKSKTSTKNERQGFPEATGGWPVPSVEVSFTPYR